MTITKKPWGYEKLIAHTSDYVGKILYIKKGQRLSRQYHKIKDETIHIYKGEILFEFGKSNTQKILKPGDSFRIKPGLIHRMTARSSTYIFEVSTPQINDVVRLEDDYGRINK